MRAAGIEPNRFAFRDAIQCCVKLGELDKAYELYKVMPEDRPPGGRGIQAIEHMGPNRAIRVDDLQASEHSIDSDTE
eukprot:7710114-Pyramimonas_sp.AAC.1